MSEHAFTPWKFDTEYTPVRWMRSCATCPTERGHCEVSASPLPPKGALGEMEPWERDLVKDMTEVDWTNVAVAQRAPSLPRHEFNDSLNR